MDRLGCLVEVSIFRQFFSLGMIRGVILPGMICLYPLFGGSDHFGRRFASGDGSLCPLVNVSIISVGVVFSGDGRCGSPGWGFSLIQKVLFLRGWTVCVPWLVHIVSIKRRFLPGMASLCPGSGFPLIQ